METTAQDAGGSEQGIEVCPFCGEDDRDCFISGYGLAFGPLGSYLFCENCNEFLEFSPDLGGIPEEEVKEILKRVEEWRKQQDLRIQNKEND